MTPTHNKVGTQNVGKRIGMNPFLQKRIEWEHNLRPRIGSTELESQSSKWKDAERDIGRINRDSRDEECSLRQQHAGAL